MFEWLVDLIKTKEKDEKKIKCKGCGAFISESNAVLDVDSGAFICRDCKGIGAEMEKLGKGGIKSAVKQQAGEEDDRGKARCKRCGFVNTYSKSRGLPDSCGYCNRKFKV